MSLIIGGFVGLVETAGCGLLAMFAINRLFARCDKSHWPKEPE